MDEGWIEALRRRAEDALEPHVAEYFRAVAGEGVSYARELADWQRFRLRPPVLRGVAEVDTATTVLGTPVASPILVAPMAQQVAAHPDGERATARAAAAAGTLLGVSTNTGVRFEDVAATGAPWWYQVYVMRDRSLTDALVDRAVAAGAEALILTVDTTVLTTTDPGVEPTAWPEGAGRNRTANYSAEEVARLSPDDMRQALDLGPAEIGRLRDRTGLPVVVKGVLRGDDARASVDAGAAGILVSTHGGRRMDGSVSSAYALPEVVDAVDGTVEVYADSGIRSGAQAAAALAQGARAVFVGRPVMWGLAADGEAGVAEVLRRYTAELAASMLQLAAPTVDDLTRDLVVR